MAIELKQSLRLSQQLVITPQLQQAIKLLQLSRLELVDLIQTELTENPILEEAAQIEDEEVPKEMAAEIEVEAAPDKSHEAQPEVGNADGELKEPKDFDWENYIGTYNAPGSEGRSFVSSDEMPTYENVITKSQTLQDHLEWQLRLSAMSTEEEELGRLIIGEIDDNGYLTLSEEDIAQKYEKTVDEISDVVELIQSFDPLGVCARNLTECLLIQNKHFGGEHKDLIKQIILEHLPLLERKDYLALSKKLKIPVKRVMVAARVISEMEPKPGRPFGGEQTQYVTPDVYVYKMGDDYAIVLNEEGLPRLQVSNFYRNMLAKANGSDDKAKGYVQDKLRSALWLIKSIHQRQRTLYRVAKCIVAFQKDFLEKGISVLKPMILRDVAEEIGVHESTVSRATTNKYIHTPQGIFELKFFFNSGVSGSTGNDVASESVKEKIRNFIASENAKKPYSDKELVDLLKESHIDIARRTVAKYREMMGVLPSSKRKRFY